MLLAHWLLCFTFLAPAAVLAQDPRTSPPPLVPAAEEAEAASSQEDAPPRGESIPYSAPGDAPHGFQASYRSGLAAPARITLEVVGGAAAGGLSGLLGLIMAEALSGGSCGDDPGCIIFGLGTTAGAIFLATPLGVYGAGRLAGGRGSYWASLLGMTVGTGAGIAMGAAFNRSSEALKYASVVMFPILGAVLGYELWHAHQRPDIAGLASTGAAGASPQLIPLAGFTPDGGVFGGLAARF